MCEGRIAVASKEADMKTNFTIASVGCLCLSAVSFAGPDWEEVCDAGSLPSTAQNTGGGVKSIKGKLGPCGPMPEGVPDLEDMYKIVINEPTGFCARTVPSTPTQDCCGNTYIPQQGSNFNTQLWLFRSNGLGLLANDNDPGNSPLSLIGHAANDGSGAAILDPGTYYIAVSGANRIPVSTVNQMTLPIFQFANSFEVSGPDGPGGGSPITGWTGPGEQGLYEIVFCGSLPAQGIPTVSQWGLIAMAGAMLAGGAILIRRRQAIPAVA